MSWFRCRACPVKDERLTAMSESHAREIATLRATHESEAAFWRGTVEALSNKLVAITAPHSYAVMQPRPARDPENDKAPNVHSPSMLRQRRVDRPSDAEVASMAARLQARLTDEGQPDPGPGNGAVKA